MSNYDAGIEPIALLTYPFFKLALISFAFVEMDVHSRMLMGSSGSWAADSSSIYTLLLSTSHEFNNFQIFRFLLSN